MTKLIDEAHLKKYHPRELDKKKYSVSTMMIYLGLKETYDFNHHEIVFSKDYEAFLKDLMQQKASDDLSYYLHNPSKLDETLAKPGHSALYILVPVPNLRGHQAWDEEKERIYAHVIDDIETRYQVRIREHIEVKKIITPITWQEEENIHLGAVFNLAHGLDQMLEKRPHNQFEEIKNLYLVGGGTHPGSGLPTIYQSALILEKLIT
jgi:phytoene desaturase